MNWQEIKCKSTSPNTHTLKHTQDKRQTQSPVPVLFNFLQGNIFYSKMPISIQYFGSKGYIS